MPSVAAAPERAGPDPPARSTSHPTRPAWVSGDVVLGLVIAAALVAMVFLTSASVDQTVTGPDTWSEIIVTLLGAGAGAAVVLIGGRGRAWGAATVGLFAGLTAFTALSILWSVQPDWSWFGTNLMVSYLAVFAGAAALARLAPGRWPAVVGAIAVAMAALSGYALLAKVFPATLAPSNAYGRLTVPFGYWNALGAGAAMGLPAGLWSAARRQRSRILAALSAPAMTLMISVLILSYSRSALLAAILGAGLWITLVPLRLRAVLMLAVGALGAVPIVAWALATPALSSDSVAAASQDAAGHPFGLVLIAALVTVTAAGFMATYAMDRIALTPALRRRVGTALVTLVALVPAGAVVTLAASSRGLTGEISHAWSTLTNPNGVVRNNSGRIGQLGNSRPLYWSQGISVGEHALLKGAGELGYGIARLRYTTSLEKTDQAHSYLVQTFADLGLIGLALTLALLAGWGVAAARTLAPRTPWRSLAAEPGRERQGLATLVAVAVAFGIQSALDWTWFFPGVTIPALICAGWLAGRGPLTDPVGRARERRRLRDRPGAGAGVTALAAVALLAAWAMWQPLRSAQQLTAAENARTNPQAFAAARAAAARDPLAVDPLVELAALYQGIRDPAAARAQLVRATQVQPENPSPWFALGSFDLQTGAWRAATAAMTKVLALDHTAPSPNNMTADAAAAITQANASLAAQRAAPR